MGKEDFSVEDFVAPSGEFIIIDSHILDALPDSLSSAYQKLIENGIRIPVKSTDSTFNISAAYDDAILRNLSVTPHLEDSEHVMEVSKDHECAGVGSDIKPPKVEPPDAAEPAGTELLEIKLPDLDRPAPESQQEKLARVYASQLEQWQNADSKVTEGAHLRSHDTSMLRRGRQTPKHKDHMKGRAESDNVGLRMPSPAGRVKAALSVAPASRPGSHISGQKKAAKDGARRAERHRNREERIKEVDKGALFREASEFLKDHFLQELTKEQLREYPNKTALRAVLVRGMTMPGVGNTVWLSEVCRVLDHVVNEDFEKESKVMIDEITAKGVRCLYD